MRQFCLAGICIVLAACQSYQPETPGRTVGQFTDDTAIQVRVKSKLWADPVLSGWLINTDVYQGVVTLRGKVSTQEFKERATNLCSPLRGVVRVNNLLQVSK